MSGISCQVRSLDERQKWETALPPDDYPHIENLLNQNHHTVQWIPALIYPVRTNNLSNFAKDLFLPTAFNHAHKVESIALRIIAMIAAIVIDLMTLPTRIVTSIPRMINNSRATELPLRKYLAEKGLPKDFLEADSVIVEIDYAKNGWIPLFTHPSGAAHHELVDGLWLKTYINFIQVPDHGHLEGTLRSSWGSDKKV